MVENAQGKRKAAESLIKLSNYLIFTGNLNYICRYKLLCK
jgi:hypothetical protein